MNLKSNNIFYAGLVLSMLLWGLGWPSTKILTHYGSPIHLAITRFFFTSITILVILFFLKEKIAIKKNGLPYLVLASVIMSVYTLCFLIGIKKGTPGAGGVLVTTLTPIATYIIILVVTKRRPNRNEFLGLLVGFIAACFLLHIWHDIHSIIQSGNLYFLGSCILWALLSRITARAKEFGSPLSFSFWTYVLCFLFLLPFAHFAELNSMMQSKEPIFWLNLFYNACINTGLATTFYFIATSKIGPAKSSSFLYIVPFAAAFFSWIIVNELFHFNTIVGGILGIGAVYIFNAKPFHTKDTVLK